MQFGIFKPKDIIALVCLVLIFLSKFLGHNGSFDTIVALILGYYFAKRQSHEDVGK